MKYDFYAQRERIINALVAAGVDRTNITLNRIAPPVGYPAAHVYLKQRRGVNATRRGYVDFEPIIEVSIALAIIPDDPDPDSKILPLEAAFRAAHLAAGGDDFELSEYNLYRGGNELLTAVTMSTAGQK